ncbi:MAG: galactose-binding domain-containing protein, partial [Planctomycetota bacterium]
RTANNNSRTENGHNGKTFNLDPWLQLERVGNTFHFRTSVDGLSWTEMAVSPITRDDMAGLPLQVGIRHATFSDAPGYIAFDNFSIEGPLVVPGFKAYNPNPADVAADAPRDADLAWAPAATAVAHDVYFGTAFDDVSNADRDNPLGVLVSQGQEASTYDPADPFEFGQTYYWRVDEVEADGTLLTGSIWSFTAEHFSYAIENITATASSSMVGSSPEKTIDGSGLDDSDLHSTNVDDMWLSGFVGPQPTWIEYQFDKVYKLHEMSVWNQNQVIEPAIGYGFKDVSIECSIDGINYTTLGTTHEFARAPGVAGYAANTTIDFGGVTAKYVKLTANSNWGDILDQYGLSEVRFFSIPVLAREPSPASAATDVRVDSTLAWRPGREAARHEVYLSTDEQDVIDGTAIAATVTEPSYTPSLDLASTYFWRIDEVNDAETPTTWQGDVWDFATQEFIVVEDFESYNDIPAGEEGSNLVYDTWADGFDSTTNGSTMGYTVPFEPTMETDTVHSGGQSAPMAYDNTTAAFSEVTIMLTGQNWTGHGVQVLSLWFFGDPTNTPGQLYAKINGVQVNYDGDPANLTRPLWQRWNIDLASVGTDLQSVTSLAIGVEAFGATGTLLLDDIALYGSVPAPPVQVYLEAEAATPLGASWRSYIDPASSGGQHIGSEDGDGDDNDTAPGAEWTGAYSFDVPDGVYKILLRAQENGSDSFWVRIAGATSQTHEDPDQPSTGWVRFNGIDAPDGWAWDEVHSNDHGDAAVNWTLPAGTHTLEIAKREDGVLLDAILITSDVD